MSPTLRATIDAAEDLAWRPTCNITRGYAERHESHQRLVDQLRGVRLPAGASPELRFLLLAIRRAAACSFANRMGHAYYERKLAVQELRGCLVVWKRVYEVAA